MFALYSDILYFTAAFVVVAVAALVGLWQYNANSEVDGVRRITLSDEDRAALLRARNRAAPEAMDERRAQMAEVRKLRKAARAHAQDALEATKVDDADKNPAAKAG